MSDTCFTSSETNGKNTKTVKPGDIVIENAEVLRGLIERNYSPLLLEIILYIIRQHGAVIIEAWRPRKTPTDLHGTQPIRAIDIDPWCYGADHRAYNIMHSVNKLWEYNPEKPKEMCADVSAARFCIRVHPKTRRRLWTQ